MKINKQLFEDVLSGKLKGRFVLRDGETYKSEQLRKNTTGVYCSSHPYRIYHASYTPDGMFYSIGDEYFRDIIDFIPETNMETKELKIEVPEGFEIDKEKSSFEKIVFKKKDTKPRSWDEYVNKTEKNEIGYFIDATTDIRACTWSLCGSDFPRAWRNVLPSKELAEAFLAMMQLMSLRQSWIGEWKWVDGENGVQWGICYKPFIDSIEIEYSSIMNFPLSFPTKEMAGDFLNTFKGLLEIAKPLL